MLTLSQWFIYTKKYMALPCQPYGGFYKKVFRCFHITNNDPNNKCASIKTENIGPNQEIIPIHLLTPQTISKLQVYLYNFRGREVLSEFFCGPVDNV